MIPYNQTKMMALEEAFPDFLNGDGIFDHIHNVDWIPDADTKLSLNMEYYLNRSGRKMASPLVSRLVDPTTGVLFSSAIEKLGKLVLNRYGAKWDKVWENFVDTSPFIDNVSLVTSTSYGKVSTREGSETLEKLGSETDTRKMTATHTEEIDSSDPLVESRAISGGYKDTTDLETSKEGSYETTESFPDRSTTKTTTGGYSDEDTVKSTKKGTEDVEETFPNRTTTKTTTGGYSDEDTVKSTKLGTEEVEETFPNRATTKLTTGGYADTDTITNTRTGTETVTESFPTARASTKQTTGGFSDTDTTTNTRTGSELVTSKGDTQTEVWGFNSATAVPASQVGPANDSTGLTQETTYGQSGLVDTKSGGVTRAYNSLTETTTESGSKQVDTTFGQSGLKDTHSGAITRSYSNLSEATTETGSHKTTTDFGVNGITDEHSGAITREYDDLTETTTESGTHKTSKSYGQAGLTDEHSGAITREYDDLTETTTEQGTHKTVVDYSDGLSDTTSGDVTRLYQNYKDEVTKTGSKTDTLSFGSDGRVDTHAYVNRSDEKTIGDEVTLSGTDEVTESGFKFNRSTDKLDLVRALFNDPSINDFFEVVYSDLDSILTCPIFV